MSNDSGAQQNQVIVLRNGYSYEDANDVNAMRANCSSSLIRCREGTNVIVDTMTAWDGESLLKLLDTEGLQAQDIHVVVCTHGHSDHIGCNYLFQKARLHVVGTCVSRCDLYMSHFADDDKEKLALDKLGEVMVERTPGHTLSCVSVVVNNTQLGGTVGICGDLFEKKDDIMDESIWQNAGSENIKLQSVERLRMAQSCAYIVPGHGPMFALDQTLLDKLIMDVQKLK